jgi:Terminase large subunit, T4likevirus-type, N-terminal
MKKQRNDSNEVSLGRDFARAIDPVLLAQDCGINPDPVQAQLLTSTSRKVLINACRQFGKSTTTALIALHEALYNAPAMIILVSPSQQQSGELFRKIHGFWQQLPGAPTASQESLTRMELSNKSRIISLPGSERTVRGFSAATLIIMDEASRVPDELLAAIRPMLATTAGRFFALSTPAGRRGWFYESWISGDGWERVQVKADECPRISPAFLEEERQALGPMRFSQEYLCEFIDDQTAVFNSDLIQQALTNNFAPFFVSD